MFSSGKLLFRSDNFGLEVRKEVQMQHKIKKNEATFPGTKRETRLEKNVFPPGSHVNH